MSKQHINTGTAALHELVERFCADWIANRLDDKPNWPLYMEPDEWWEHFIVFAQEKAGKRSA